MKPLITLREACELTRISRATIYNMIRKGELPVVKLGRRTLIRAEHLAAFIDARTMKPVTPQHGVC
ncbi:MAG TPA: helix-turn-helix domain-containing protein [Microvirga sp.]|jgi:excisionase family DNA binding protein|nr:helix-turn-helix domain-containing protein [Microvirga sp.]